MVKKILKTKKQIKKYKGGAGSTLKTCTIFTNYIKKFKNFKNIKEVLETKLKPLIEQELEIFIKQKSGEIIINSNTQLPKPKTAIGLIKPIIKKSITELLTKPSNNKTIKNISLSIPTDKKINTSSNKTNLNENNLFENFTINEEYLNTYFNTYINQLEKNKLQNLSKKITTQQTETIELSNNNLNKLFKNNTIPDIKLDELFKPNCSNVN